MRDIVREELDLTAILSAYTEARGFPPYDPAMMVALLLYSYSRGVYSSRRIARTFLRHSIPSRIVSSHRIIPERPFIIWAPTSREANSG